jgi:hypothetical protein
MRQLLDLNRELANQLRALAEGESMASVRIRDSQSLAAHLQNGFLILAEHDLMHPDPDSMRHVVEASLASRHLFFAAALYEPSELDLSEFFQNFVLRCFRPVLDSGGL